MLYFAELYKKHVITTGGAQVGRLTDLVFLASGQPLITKLCIRRTDGVTIAVPVTNLKMVNGAITLAPGYETAIVAENELTLRRHLLDQQIIDIKGNKVVRVNDVAIQDKPYLVVAGVDVGLMGIARWIKLEQFINTNLGKFGKIVRSEFLPWEDIQPVELSRGKVVLKREETKLTRLPPEDLADHLERVSVKNLNKILDLLPTEYEAEVIQNLNISRQRAYLKSVRPETAAQLLARIDPDEAVDMLLTLTSKRREMVMAQLSEATRQPIHYLMSVASTDIGGLMNNEYMTADPEETAGSVKRRVKISTGDFSWLAYIYVVNKRRELAGVFNLHELTLQIPEIPVYKFMIPNVITAYLTTPPEIALKKMVKYKIYALPIINEKRELLGVVTMDDVLETMMDKLT